MRKARAIAFYLPQFHPIPENDAWWGEGFTEWTNVKKGVPLFRGHQQPRFPGELGFYDLRNPEVRQKQATLARDHGIEGFCYWHYWFGNGRRILEKVFDDVLHSGKPDFPFCLAWANETWTGIWHGAEDRILAEQTYPGKEDYLAHFRHLLPAFRDKRYIRVNDKPLFVVYRPHEIPDVHNFVSIFRSEAQKNGLADLYLVGNNVPPTWDPRTFGFDAVAPVRLDTLISTRTKILTKIKSGIKAMSGITVENVFKNGPFVYDYSAVMQRILNYHEPEYRQFPNVLPNWDNTPRSGKRGWVLQGSNPELFQSFMEKALEKIAHYPQEEKIIFIKSWNEWAEGNYLEPDHEHGRKYLEACKDALFSR